MLRIGAIASCLFIVTASAAAACSSSSTASPTGTSDPSNPSGPGATDQGGGTGTTGSDGGTGTGSDDSGSSTTRDAAAPGPRTANIERWYHSTCTGDLGLYYKGGGRPGTSYGASFQRYPSPPTCTTRSVGECTSIACPGNPNPKSFFRGDVWFESSAGNQSVPQSGEGYRSGTTSSLLLPPAGETVTISLRGGTPTGLSFELPSPGALTALLAPLKNAKIPRSGGLTLTWTNGDIASTTKAYVSVLHPNLLIECVVDAALGTVTVPSELTTAMPTGEEVDITVDAATERFDNDDECMVRTLLTRTPTNLFTPITFE